MTSNGNFAVSDPKYSCNGAIYGRNLNLASCYQVWRIMSSDGAMETYGQRGSGNWRAKLPFRYVSSDGLCAIDISHSTRATHDQMRPGDLKNIVRVLIDVCVRGTPNQGGIASNIGVHGNLAVRVVPYKPTVVCGAPGSGAPFVSCRDIVDEMPADGKKNVFGPKDDPETTVPIPFVLAPSQRCSLLLSGQGPAEKVKDTSDWYKIFAASAFLSLCSSLVTKYFTVHDPPISALVTFSFLCTPPNYLWQQFIEHKLPAYTTNKIEVDDGGKGVEVEKKLNIWNTMVKLLLEQTIIAAINVGAFLGFTKWFQGMPVEGCIQVIREVGDCTSCAAIW
ncbi:MAG: hypothetical protein Q9191_006925 [Dirinaria sp. TL-2023a]